MVNRQVPDISFKPVFSFYVMQYLNASIDRYLAGGDISGLTGINNELETNFDTDSNDPYPFIHFKRYLAISKFYSGDYSGAAKCINGLRNDISMKKYFHTDVECKLFQALNYCMIGEDGLCNQLLQSVKRQVTEDEVNYESASTFIRLIKIALKPDEFRRKVSKLNDIWHAFNNMNTGPRKILTFLKLDESALRRMANPIKD